jgi:hypothetical protein
MNLTPASSMDTPSAPILTRVSVSGTRLTQTAIFTCRLPPYSNAEIPVISSPRMSVWMSCVPSYV